MILGHMILNPAVDPSFVNLAHDPQQFFGPFDFYLLGEFAMGRIARFLRHRIALQLLGMEWPFRVVAPCLAPQKPHTPPRPNCRTYDERISTGVKLKNER